MLKNSKSEISWQNSKDECKKIMQALSDSFQLNVQKKDFINDFFDGIDIKYTDGSYFRGMEQFFHMPTGKLYLFDMNQLSTIDTQNERNLTSYGVTYLCYDDETRIGFNYKEKYFNENIYLDIEETRRTRNDFGSLPKATVALKRITKIFIDEFFKALEGRISEESLNRIKTDMNNLNKTLKLNYTI